MLQGLDHEHLSCVQQFLLGFCFGFVSRICLLKVREAQSKRKLFHRKNKHPFHHQVLRREVYYFVEEFWISFLALES